MKSVARKASKRTPVAPESGTHPIAPKYDLAVTEPQPAAVDHVDVALEILREGADGRVRKLYSALGHLSVAISNEVIDHNHSFSSSLIELMKLVTGLEADINEAVDQLEDVPFSQTRSEVS